MARRAKKNYKPEELIYSGYPYVVAVKTGSNRCENCFKLSFELKRCQKCLFARYCQKSCQKEAWSDHKLECRFLKNFPDSKDSLLIRLISLLILKIKDKKWEDIYECVEGEKVSFADMWSNFEGMTKSPKSLLILKGISAVLNKYLGPEKLPNQERMLEIIDKVSCNAIGDNIGEDQSTLSLYIGIGNIQPSCIPNARTAARGPFSKKIEVMSTAEIRENDKITTSKFSIITTLCWEKVNPSVVECMCDDCLKPYGESVLTKIVDDTLAYSVIARTEDLIMRANLFPGLKNNPKFIKEVEDVLEQQEDVLGNTHFLRLRLLAWKVFHMEDSLFSTSIAAKKLLKYAKEAFGEHNYEVKMIDLLSKGLDRQLFNALPFQLLRL